MLDKFVRTPDDILEVAARLSKKLATQAPDLSDLEILELNGFIAGVMWTIDGRFGKSDEEVDAVLSVSRRCIAEEAMIRALGRALGVEVKDQATR